MLFTSLICLLITLAVSSVQNDQHKRLLFNDPQTLQTLYEELQSKVEANENALHQALAELSTLQSENSLLNQKVKVLEGKSASGGTTYVRWGRKSCPSDNRTELVYDGTVGGSYYAHTGSGVDYLCLPHNPDNSINPSSITLQQHYHTALLFGAEYGGFSYRRIAKEDDVPCAVCLVRDASSALMIPAKITCPHSWTKQYSGLLSSNEYTYAASSEYVCLDGDPEYIDGTRSRNQDGKLFYTVKAVCGALPCPPYVNGSYMECVVCTK